MADEMVPLTSPNTPDPTPADNPPRRRSRWRWVWRGSLFLLLILAGLAWFAPALAVHLGLLNRVVAQALTRFDGKVHIDGGSLAWLAPVELHNVTVTDAQGRTMLTAPRISTSKTLWELLRAQDDLGTFTLENPVSEIIHEQQTTNIEHALTWYIDEYEPTGEPGPEIHVHVVNGSLTFIDQERPEARSYVMNAIAAELTIPRESGQPIPLKLKGTIGEATSDRFLEGDVGFGAEIGGSLKAQGFPLAALEPFIRRAQPNLTLAGDLTGDLQAGFVWKNGGFRSTRLAGELHAAPLQVQAPFLGPDTLTLDRVELPCSMATRESTLIVGHAHLTCDLGQAQAHGEVDLAEPLEGWLARSGVELQVDADLSRVVARFPQLLHIRDGLDLREGRVRMLLASQANAERPLWEGSLKTSALKGTHNGKALVWEQPLELDFAGRLGADLLPTFEKLNARADFGTITAKGTLEQFQANVDLSFDRLAEHLRDFVDMQGVTLAGNGRMELAMQPTGMGLSTMRGSAKLVGFQFQTGETRLVEPNLTLDLNATGRLGADGPTQIATGRVGLAADGDWLDIRLLEPIADLDAMTSGKVTAEVSGDLARWRDRLARVTTIPTEWKLTGSGKLGGTVRFDPSRLALENVTGELNKLHFFGAGLLVDEPQVKVYPTAGFIDRKSGQIDIDQLQLATQTLGLATERILITPDDQGYAVSCKVLVNANLARLQRTLGVQSAPNQADAVAGMVRAGTLNITTQGGQYRFTAKLPVENLQVGPERQPTWTEPQLLVLAEGAYDRAQDLVQLVSATVERPDSLAVTARGTIGQASTQQDLNLQGQVRYDLAKLEPQLRDYLGKGVKAVGQDARDYRIQGKLAGPVAEWTGNASVAWKSLSAYGFAMGQGELQANLHRGVLQFNPLTATFSETGQVRVTPAVNLLSPMYDLVLAKGRIVDKAKLTPAACADAIGYALPALAQSSQAEGTVSFDLEENRIPLQDPERSTITGRLTLHEVRVGPGPVIKEVLTMFGTDNTLLTLANDQVVPVRLENGRVYHEGLTLTANNFTVKTSGSVGLDSSLDLVAEVPVPETAIAAALRNTPRVREALLKHRIQVPIWGTLSKPRLDPRAFQASVRRFTEDVARDAARNKLGDLFQKGQEKLEERLEKRLEKILPPPPPKKD